MAIKTRSVNHVGRASEPGYRWIALTVDVTDLHAVPEKHADQVVVMCGRRGKHDRDRTVGDYCLDCLYELQQIHLYELQQP